MVLFIAAVLPVILIGLFIYNKDKEKEPKKLLLKLFLGGVSSCFLVLLVSGILSLISPIFAADTDNQSGIELIIHVFIGVAFVEELCKWIMVYKFSFNDSAFDEMYDAILYCVFVALGFACFENILYVFDSGLGTAVVRALLAVPGHACDGVFMGYYLGIAKRGALNDRKDLKTKYLALSLIVPTITHGIYDYCLMNGSGLFILIFLVFVISMYIYIFKKVKHVSSKGEKIRNVSVFCPNCGTKFVGKFCAKCGTKRD